MVDCLTCDLSAPAEVAFQLLAIRRERDHLAATLATWEAEHDPRTRAARARCARIEELFHAGMAEAGAL